MKALFATLGLLTWMLGGACAFAQTRTDVDAPADKDQVVRLFVFAGQSNMEGADTSAADIDRYPGFEGVGTPRADVRYWSMLGRPGPKHDTQGWVPLGPDHHGRFGPELTFAQSVTRATRGPIAIVKSAWGGTTLAVDWDPDAPSEKRLFARTLELIRRAQKDLTERGIEHRLEAFVWHQGENDMLDRKLMHGYGASLAAFIARWRTELGAPELPWFVGEISDKGIWGLDHRRNMQIVRKQQRAVTDADPRAWFVPTSHLAFDVMKNGQPHYHFGTEGQLHHGLAYAAAYLKTKGARQFVFEARSPYYGLSPYGRARSVRVFILAGQRSAEGDGCYVTDANILDSDSQVPLHYRLAGGLATGFRPLSAIGLRGTFGPEMTLGSALRRGLPDEQIAIIKVTDSAAVLADWLPNPDNASRPQYAGSLEFIRNALQMMRRAGATPSVEAVFWIPGEHDCYWAPFRRRYGKDLQTLVAAVRADLESPKLAWIVPELPDNMRWGKERLDELDAQISQVASRDPRVWFVPTDSIDTPRGSVTFGTKGTIALGTLLARHYLEEVRKAR